MNPEQKVAYEWAKNQNYQSVAAQYAKALAELVDDLNRRAQPANEPLTLEQSTNADRIRGMTDEELAKIIAAEPILEKIPFCKNKSECKAMLDAGLDIPESMCAECVFDWLRQPAEEVTT